MPANLLETALLLESGTGGVLKFGVVAIREPATP
jgi:hypothetical protein